MGGRRAAVAAAVLVLAGCAQMAANQQLLEQEQAPYNACVSRLTVLQGPVSIPYRALGTVQDSGVVWTSLGQLTAIRNATWDACGQWPDADAIVNFSGDSRGNQVWYSGIVVQWLRPLGPTATPERMVGPNATPEP
jgi:hypothetical protein